MHVPSLVICLSNDCCSPVLASGRNCFPVNVDHKVCFLIIHRAGLCLLDLYPSNREVNDVIVGQLVYKQGSLPSSVAHSGPSLVGCVDSVWTGLVSPRMQGWSTSPAARGWRKVKWPSSSARSGEARVVFALAFLLSWAPWPKADHWGNLEAGTEIQTIGYPALCTDLSPWLAQLLPIFCSPCPPAQGCYCLFWAELSYMD